MLSVKSYDAAHVARCREHFATLCAGLQRASLPDDDAVTASLTGALVLALDNWFCHRMRGQEGKDGNPLNEVRMLAASIQAGASALLADSTIRYQPDRSVTGLVIGQPVRLTLEMFERLCGDFLTEIERRFP